MLNPGLDRLGKDTHERKRLHSKQACSGRGGDGGGGVRAKHIGSAWMQRPRVLGENKKAPFFCGVVFGGAKLGVPL